jgi:L-aminopeptidase/D-esterase-like protein
LVPAAINFDLAQGEARAPDAADGYAAAAAATRGPWQVGAVGAGTGATAAKISGPPVTAGIGIAIEQFGDQDVTAVVVLNAVGDIVDPSTGALVAGRPDAAGRPQGQRLAIERAVNPLETGQNTTLGAVLISRPIDAQALNRCCISAHDAFARCVVPAHTPFDGDLFFAAAPATAPVEANELLGLCCAVEIAVQGAILGIFQGDGTDPVRN